MWYVKKAASKVVKASQILVKQVSESQKLIKDIISNKHEVMPTKKMATLAANSFQTQKFEQTVEFMIQKLNDIKFEKKSLKKRLNLLVLVAYLIKHGVSGFIDEFRDNIDSFTKYERLSMNDSIEEKESWTKIVIEIENRAKYIKQLLTDKAVLWREKEVGRLIREKMMLQKGDYSKHNPYDKQNSQETNQQQKVQSFLEHYLWRYTSKLDKKLDQITDALIEKIDKYLDGEIPQSFDIDEIEEQSNKSTITRTEFYIKGESQIKKQLEFIKQRIPENLLIKHTNLLQLQDIETIKHEQQIDLLEFKEEKLSQKNNKEARQIVSQQIKK